MSDDAIRFDRKPYKVTYQDLKGETKTIRRVPPEKQHEALPTDIVTLTRKKSDDFDEGDELTVKHINPRHPNVLQLSDEAGKTTFVEHYDIQLHEEIAPRAGVDPRDRPINSKYLLWP